MTEESTTSRPPVYLPTYSRGDEGKPNHFQPSISRDAAAADAKSLAVGDSAFIKRSDLKWTYATVTERVEPKEGDSNSHLILRFEVDKERNRKNFPEPQWGKYIRVIKVDEAEFNRLKEVEAAEKAKEGGADAEVAAAKPADEAPKAEGVAPEETPKEEAKKEEKEAFPSLIVPSSTASVGGGSVKSGTSSKVSAAKATSSGASGWLSGIVEKTGIFGGKKAAPDAESIAPATETPTAVPESVVPSTVAPATEAPSAAAGAAVDEIPAVGSTASRAASVEVGADGSIETPVVASPMVEDPAAMALSATSFPKPSMSKEESVSAPQSAPAVAVSAVETAPTPPPAPETEQDDTKENSNPKEIKLTQPTAFLPSPKAGDSAPLETAKAESSSKDNVSALRNPLNLKPTISLKKKGSLVSKLFNKKDKSSPKPEEKKVMVVSTPTALTANGTPSDPLADPKTPKMLGDSKKEWFDPEAHEVDYDKNPTDLFQALEARQFAYADEMFQQVHVQFTRECRTWVVARGQKKKDSSQLRFRALPLHAALVFGAPDDMVKKILNAYPKATRGRDVKGRLPIHLAMEHNASEEIVCLLLENFPKGFFAKDKKDMLPMDYVTNNMNRQYQKRYVPVVAETRVEEERAKWEIEKNNALEQQKVALKNDPEYMEDVIARITDDVETTYASKMELLEANYQKEIALLKKKHDSETQALLEGFEVKLNFERKLNRLKSAPVKGR